MPYIIREVYEIPDNLIQEAYNYALLSRKYTSNRHDFHSGGLNNKQQKMFEGKLGEKIFKMFLLDNNIPFQEDTTPYYEEDNYDFMIGNGTTIDVKTRTKSYHTRTLEMVEKFEANPKDVYVSVHLDFANKRGTIVGWTVSETIERINRIENNGYLDNYVLYDDELYPIEDFEEYYFELTY